MQFMNNVAKKMDTLSVQITETAVNFPKHINLTIAAMKRRIWIQTCHFGAGAA